MSSDKLFIILASLIMMALAAFGASYSLIVADRVIDTVVVAIVFFAIPLFVYLTYRAVLALETIAPRLTSLLNHREANEGLVGKLPVRDDDTLENPYQPPFSK
jgi:hypothetical protein